MRVISLKSAWKNKTNPTNIFDDNFIREKDLALQPINFFYEAENLIKNENFNNKNIIKNNNNLKESAIYDSNIVIIKEQTDDDTELSSFNNQIGKEIKKINSLMMPEI